MSRKNILISLATGILLSLSATFFTGSLTFKESSGICPGIPYSVNAEFRDGFPFSSTFNVKAKGSCGEITSRPTLRNYGASIKTNAFFMNLVYWILISAGLVNIFSKLTKKQTKKSKNLKNQKS